ncbi:MAG: acyloxyacyl hydrolase [Sphingomicrobium sp.]
MRLVAMLAAALTAAVIPSAAEAGELFGGVFVHDVKTPLDKSGIESGIDFSVGYRGGAIAHLFSGVLQPYLFGAVNSAGDTDYAAAGIAVKFPLGRKWYIRPGFGLAIHDGSAAKYYRSDKIAFGSRVLFEPELGIGTRLNRRLSLEASWIHMSHAQVFGKENPGMDNIGMRLNLAL